MAEELFDGADAPERAAVGRRLVDTLLAERDHWPLWIPVAMGIGIATYFALPVEPPFWVGAVATMAALVMAVVARHNQVWLVVAIAALALGGGFAAAQFRTAWVAAPVLEKEIRPAYVSGRVVASEIRVSGRRLVLDNVRISGLDPDATPARVRVTLRGSGVAGFRPGQWVELRGALSPPPEPSAPGAFDFARHAYFKQLGGVGFAFGSATVIDPPAGHGGGGLAVAVGNLRQAVTDRVLAGLDGQAGAVAAALLTGERGAIHKDVLAAMRDAGLAHLLAISGLHIGLVAGILFFVSRALLALWEPVALRYPIKKWAAVAALAGTAFYLLLSGATIPTQRAFLMGGLVIVAILLDRTGISLRSVAWAAVAVLLVQPESLLGPSFQMSFAAVVGLVAGFEWYHRRRRWRSDHTLSRRLLDYFTGVVLATLIAGLATAPFAAYTFNRLADYSLAANFVAVPLTALWIMPWGVAALALMPFGLEAVALAAMGWGIDAVIAVAREVSSWSGAVTLIPAMPVAGVVMAAAGGLWLCLWRQPWRWPGAVVFAAALATTMLYDAPDVLVDGKAKLFAVRAPDGELALSSRKAARYTGDIWLRRDGQTDSADWPDDATWLRCDGAGCIYRRDGHVVALVRDGRALADDCRMADIVISAVPVRRDCSSATVVVDRFDVWRHGAHAIYFEENGAIRVENVADARGARPWTACRGRDCD